MSLSCIWKEIKEKIGLGMQFSGKVLIWHVHGPQIQHPAPGRKKRREKGQERKEGEKRRVSTTSNEKMSGSFR